MIKGLQIAMRGDELSRTMTKRIEAREATLSALDARLKKHEGAQPYDVYVEDGLESIGELEITGQRQRDRLVQLRLVRDNLVAEELYILSRTDLCLADVISEESTNASSEGDGYRADDRKSVIDGLKLTMSGPEVRTLLEERIAHHRRCAERWKREQARTPAEQTEESPLLPDEMCGNEAERHEWRVEVLEFIRRHIDATEVYRLGEADLEFGELLPEKPGAVEQEEYEERNRVGFSLESLAKRIGGSAFRREWIDGEGVIQP